VLFFVAEIGGATVYLLAGRRNRKDSEDVARVMHQINEQQDRTNGSSTHSK